MFKNEFQGGNFFEIFSAQGKDPTGVWKLQGGSGIRKIYEKEVKSFVYNLEGTVATTKMQLPNNLKHSLSLVQRYLIFQLNVPKGGEFSIEIGVTDIGNNKRRLNLSTSVKETTATPLHAKIPLTVLRKSVWVNCCCDMVNIVGDTWHGQTFGKIDSLTISANCKLRRIITMKHQPHDTTDDDGLYGSLESADTAMDSIPRQHQLASDVKHYTQLINMHKIRAAEIKLRGDKPTPIDLDLSSSGRRTQLNESFHIAFGTKIGKPPTAGVGRKSTSSGLPSHRDSMRASAGGAVRDSYTEHMTAQPGTARLPRTGVERIPLSSSSQHNNISSGRQRLLSDPGKITDLPSRSNNPLNESKSWSGAEMSEQKSQETAIFSKPHPPPRDTSAEGAASRRRQAKIRSGERQHRTPADAHLKPITDNKHQHTVSAPATHYKPSEPHSPTRQPGPQSGGTQRAHKLAPLSVRGEVPAVQSSYEPQQRGRRGLQPIDSREPPNHARRLNINNHNSVGSKPLPVTGGHVPSVWTSQNLPTATERWYNEDNHTEDHLERGRMNPHTRQLESDTDSEDEDRAQLIDSLEKFAAEDFRRESSDDPSDEEPSAQPGLFQFRSPPKGANKNINRLRANGLVTNDQMNGVRKQLQPHLDGAESEPRPPDKPASDKIRNHRHTRPSELPVYNQVYNPSAYKQSDSDHKPDTKPPAVPHHMLEPRPPDSPRPGSRPGSRPNSGRLRSRGGSKASNHSNKPTPESSGTGEELSKQLHNGHHTDSTRIAGGAELSPLLTNRVELASRRILKQGDDLPSPRTSHMEPRISSAGRRRGSGSAGSRTGSSSSSREDQLGVPPHIQQLRMSDRAPSPLSSRGSTRLSRKSLREIPDTDERLINAQISSSPTRAHYDPTDPQNDPSATIRPQFQHVDDTFDEEHMLQFLAREQELGGSLDEQNNVLKKQPPKSGQYDHQGLSDGEHSSDESIMTTSVPVIGAHDYRKEMEDTLQGSDTRDFSMFSPPIVTASQRKSEEHFNDTLNSSYLHKSNSYGGGRKHKRLSSDQSAGAANSDHDEEELDLLYDPVLSCYYDPNTHKYYELL